MTEAPNIVEQKQLDELMIRNVTSDETRDHLK
jgi:hypothetical protein